MAIRNSLKSRKSLPSVSNTLKICFTKFSASPLIIPLCLLNVNYRINLLEKVASQGLSNVLVLTFHLDSQL